jgi:hypothetical protein
MEEKLFLKEKVFLYEKIKPSKNCFSDIYVKASCKYKPCKTGSKGLV